MNQSSLSNTHSKSTTLILFFLLTYLSLSVQLDQCSNPGATLYDGYLDTFIYYASFNRDQSSYFKLRNPFQGLRLQSTGSVMFWARLPKLSDDGALQRGRFFECADTLTARLDNQYIRTNITVNVTLANGSATTQLAKYTLDVQQFQNSTDPLLQWNSYAFSFSGGKLRTHFNGVQIAEVAIASPFMNTNSDFCTVGNSLDFKDPFNGYMRHLVFSRDGFSSSQDLTSKIRSIVLPNDANVLAYFNFGKDFNFYETYYYNSSRNFAASNLAISYASEPEQVCYCTNSYPPILRIGKDFKLRPLDLTPLNATVDQNGITLQFWIYPLRLENGDNDSAIFSLTNYTDIVLTNKGTNLRVDLYNSSTAIAQKIVLNKYRFRLQFWTLYSIQIYSNQVILTVDGVEVDRQTHSVALPTMPLSQFRILPQPSLQANLYKVSMSQNLNSNIEGTIFDINPLNEQPLPVENYTQVFAFTLTKDRLLANNLTSTMANLTAGVFISSHTDNTIDLPILQILADGSYFYFDQRNDFCVNQTQDSLSTLFDGISCKAQRSSPRFVNTTGTTAQLSGRARTFNQPQTTIDFWFQPDELIFSETQNTSVLFKNYLNSTNGTWTASLNIYLMQDANGTPTPVCDLKYPSDNNLTMTNSSVFSTKQWLHYACIFNNDTRTLSSILYNAVSQSINTASMGIGINVNVTQNTTMMSYIGNNQIGTRPFQGLIREVRITKAAFTYSQIRVIRFQKLPRAYIENFVLNAFYMSAGYQSLTFDSAFVENNSTINSSRQLYSMNVISPNAGFQWMPESNLVICPVDTYYDGTCCSKIDFVSPNIALWENESTFFVNLTLNSSLIERGVFYNWTLLKISSTNINDPANNRSRYSVDAVVQSLKSNQNLSIPTSLMLYNQSYTLNVRVQSPHLSKSFNLTQEIFLQCPRAFIMNKTNPIIHQWGYETKIYLMGQNINNCYQPVINKLVSWSHNNTAGDPYSLTSDRLAVIFNKENLIKNDSIITVNFTVNYTNGINITDSRQMIFLTNSVVLNVLNKDIYIPDGTDLYIDATQTQFLLNTVPLNELTYTVSCPTTLVSNSSRDCVMQNNGNYTLAYKNIFKPIPYTDYYFNVTAGKPRTAASMTQSVKVRWFSQSSDPLMCPGINVPASTQIARIDFKSFVFQPTFYMDCLQTDNTYKRLNKSSITYTYNYTRLAELQNTTNQTLVIQNFQDGFLPINDGYQIKFINESQMQKYRPGDIIPIIVNITMIDLSTNETVNSTSGFELVVKISDLVVSSNISSTLVNFEDDLIINASASYDPDYSMNLTSPNTSVITYQYFCNNVLCVLDNSQMQSGVLRLTLLDKIRLGYVYNQPFKFEIVMKNPLVPAKNSSSAVYTAQFLAPTNGTHKCPRSYYYNKTFNGVRYTNHYYSTANVTDNIYQLAFENCDSLANQLNYMLVDIPKTGLVKEGNSQILLTNPNNASFTLLMSGLLSQIPVNQSLIIKTSTIFNYTNATNFKKIGYQVNELILNRTFSTLIPVMNPNNTKGSVAVGQEEILFVDALQSYDPDAQYLTTMPQNITYVYNCSANINSYCPTYQNQQQIALTKKQRLNLTLNAVNANFWIAVSMKANGRVSNITNQTFTIGTQDYSRCFKITDKVNQIVVDDIENYPRSIVLKPNYQLICEEAVIAGDMIWTSQNNTNKTSWISLTPKNTSVMIPLEVLLNLTRGNKYDFSVKVPFRMPNNNTIMYTANLTYNITVNAPKVKAVIESASPINMLGDSANITASLVNGPNSSSVCTFVCYFGDVKISNCANTTTCTFDILPLLLSQYQQMMQSNNNLVVYAEVSTQGKTYTTTKALTFVQVDGQPQCQIVIDSNPNFQPDLSTIFKCVCVNYKTSELNYSWKINNINATAYANGNSNQVLKLKPFSLQNIPLNTLQVVVVVSEKLHATNTAIVQSLFTTKQMNISEGQIVVTPKEGFARQTMFTININNFQDNNGGFLYYQVKYVDPNNKVRYLTTKTTDGSNYTTVLPMIDHLIVEIYDQTGNYQQRQVYLNISDTLPITDLEYINYYNFIRTFLPNSITVTEPNIDSSDIELGLNTMKQAASIIMLSLTNLTTDPTLENNVTYYCSRFVNRTEFMLNALKNISTNNDTKVNSLILAEQIFYNCFDPTLAPRMAEIIINNTDTFMLFRGDDLAQQLSQSTLDLLMLLSMIPEVNQEHISQLGLFANGLIKSMKTNMVTGEIMENIKDKTILKKVSKDDVPAGGVIVTNNNIQFQLPQAALASLNIGEGYISTQVINMHDFNMYNASDTNLTMAADVIEISIQDSESQQYPVKNQTSTITFGELKGESFNNLMCGYFDPAQKKWLLESDGGLVTEKVTSDIDVKIKCTTNHLSTFSVFQIQDPYYPIVVSAPLDNGKVAVYVIMAILMFISLILFIIQVRTEKKKRDQSILTYDFKQLQDKITFGMIFANYSKLVSLCKGAKLNCLNRFLILLNYVLWISLFILIHFAITKFSSRTIGDCVYLIAAVVFVFLFSAPLIQHVCIYVFFKFQSIQKFSNIFQEDPSQNGPGSFEKSNANFKTSKEEQSNGNVDSKKSSQPPVDEPKSQMIPINDSTIGKDQKELRLNSIKEEQKTEDVIKKQDKTIFDTSSNPHRQSEQESDIEALRKTNLMSPKNDNEDMYDGQYTSSGDRGRVAKQNLKQLSKDIQIKTIQQKESSKKEYEGGYDEEASRRIDSMLSQNEMRVDYEGGSEDEEGNKASSSRSISNLKSNKSTKYSTKELDLSVKNKKPVEKKEYGEAIEVRQGVITLLQVIFFLISGGLNGFLFFWVGIDIPFQIRDYIACLLISIAFLFVILDVLVSAIAANIIKSKGIKEMSTFQIAMSLGFIGLDRLKTL